MHRPSLLDLLEPYDSLVEIGIGRRTDVAADLAESGVEVIATDVTECPVPDGVQFVIDDITDPKESLYCDADAMYALRLPPELQKPATRLASTLGITLYFTTLGGDPAVVPVETRTIEEGTVFVSTGQHVQNSRGH